MSTVSKQLSMASRLLNVKEHFQISLIRLIHQVGLLFFIKGKKKNPQDFNQSL